MSYSLINSVKIEGGQNGGTTAAIDTTGSNLIVIVASHQGGLGDFAVSDSKGNIWTPLTERDSGFGSVVRIFYCFNPTVGSGHTFTSSGTNVYPALMVGVWAGARLNPSEAETGAASNSTGTISPLETNELIISGIVHQTIGNASPDSGFTSLFEVPFNFGNNYAGSYAYKIQTSPNPENVTWTSVSAPASTIATFKAADGSGATKPMFSTVEAQYN